MIDPLYLYCCFYYYSIIVAGITKMMMMMMMMAMMTMMKHIRQFRRCNCICHISNPARLLLLKFRLTFRGWNYLILNGYLQHLRRMTKMQRTMTNVPFPVMRNFRSQIVYVSLVKIGRGLHPATEKNYVHI